MLELISKVISSSNEIIWGPAMIIAIVGVGFYMTAGTRFIQFLNFRAMFKETILRRKKKAMKGDITPFQALNVALAGTVGVGNIAGVATAIALGGPGAVFWMWASGLLGMATKFSEVVLGMRFRIRQFHGPMLGGPMLYIRRGMGRRYRWLAGTFAVLGALAAFGLGNMVQANSVAQGAKEFGIPPLATGIFLVVAVGLVTVGGIKRIARVAMVCVPFMCIIYFFAAIYIIISHFTKLPQALMLILKGAFTPTAACGGFAGATILGTVRYGIARGVFSNEAGLGSAPMAHATAKTDHPSRQGLWGIFEVFIDTIVICSATALAIIVTGVWTSGETGALLTMMAFEKNFGQTVGFSIVVLCMMLTAYDTNFTWCFYGETCSAYLFGPKARSIYRVVWLPFVLMGALGKLEIVWNLSDTLNGLMVIPNLVALVFLSKLVFKLTRDFLQKEGLRR